MALDDDLLRHRLLHVRILHDDVIEEGEFLLLFVDVEEPLLSLVLDLEMRSLSKTARMSARLGFPTLSARSEALSPLFRPD